MSNADPKAFRDRYYNILKARVETSEDWRELTTEMRSAGHDPITIAGTQQAARMMLLDDAKRAKRHAIHQFSLSLGD